MTTRSLKLQRSEKLNSITGTTKLIDNIGMKSNEKHETKKHTKATSNLNFKSSIGFKEHQDMTTRSLKFKKQHKTKDKHEVKTAA